MKKRVLGKTALPSILSLLDEHNDNMNKLIGVKYSWGTLKNYYTLRRHLVSFLNTISLKDLEIKKKSITVLSKTLKPIYLLTLKDLTMELLKFFKV